MKAHRAFAGLIPAIDFTQIANDDRDPGLVDMPATLDQAFPDSNTPMSHLFSGRWSIRSSIRLKH